LNRHTRRQFLWQAAGTTAGALLWANANGAASTAALDLGADDRPGFRFPQQARERISVSSYPFREFIIGRDAATNAASHKMEIKEFAAHVIAKFNINKIEPWSNHFLKLEGAYLEEIRAAVKKVGAMIVNVAVDGEHSPYAADPAERDRAVAFSKKWIDAAAMAGSSSVRTNIPRAKDSEPDVERAADSLRRAAEYGSSKQVVVNLENDNPVSEDPFFLTQVIDKVNSPWLRALPDFGNSLATGKEEHAYAGVDAMFGRAYNICHVKAMESNDAGQVFHVDMAKTFGMLKSHGYKGYCSMEWDSPGDPYRGTQDLIAETVRYLS
jgi:sugar phosphate isomerase/epimerase